MSEQTYLGWRDGLPTAPDVEAICSKFPDLKVGDEAPYADIEALLKITQGSSRWKSVTDAWRRRLAENGIVIECRASEAFYVASADQVSSATYDVLRGIGRRARKHRQKIAVSKPENDRQRGVLEHQALLMQEIERHSKKARTNLLPSTSVPERPKIEPPKQMENDDRWRSPI